MGVGAGRHVRCPRRRQRWRRRHAPRPAARLIEGSGGGGRGLAAGLCWAEGVLRPEAETGKGLGGAQGLQGTML